MGLAHRESSATLGDYLHVRPSKGESIPCIGYMQHFPYNKLCPPIVREIIYIPDIEYNSSWKEGIIAL